MILFYCKTCRRYMIEVQAHFKTVYTIEICRASPAFDTPEQIEHKLMYGSERPLNQEDIIEAWHFDDNEVKHNVDIVHLDSCPHNQTSEYWEKDRRSEDGRFMHWRCELCGDGDTTEIKIEKPQTKNTSNDPGLGGKSK